jgi:hypothetical protein
MAAVSSESPRRPGTTASCSRSARSVENPGESVLRQGGLINITLRCVTKYIGSPAV